MWAVAAPGSGHVVTSSLSPVDADAILSGALERKEEYTNSKISNETKFYNSFDSMNGDAYLMPK